MTWKKTSIKNLELKILIVSIEQLYPFPQAEIKDILSQKDAREYIWCQEEPKNQGPWKYIKEMFEYYLASEILNKKRFINKKIHLSCISRPQGPLQTEVTMQYSKRNKWK